MIDESALSALSDKSQVAGLFSETSHHRPETQAFWKAAIFQYLRKSKRLSFTINEISQYYTIFNIFPVSLKPCVEMMVPKSELVLRSTLAKRDNVLQTTTNVISAIWTTSYNILTLYSNTAPSPIDGAVELSMPFLLENLSQSIAEFAASNSDFVFYLDATNHPHHNFGNFLKRFSVEGVEPWRDVVVDIRTNDALVLVDYLVQKNLATVSNDRQVIKIISKTAESNPADASANITTISEVDLAQLKLKSSISMVEEKLSKLREKCEYHTKKALQLYRDGHKSAAIVEMKIKKAVSESEGTLSNALITLVTTSERLESSRMNVMIVSAYRSASEGLKAIHESPGMSLDNIDDAMFSFQEQLDNSRAVDEALQGSLNDISESEQDELKAELSDLMQADLDESFANKVRISSNSANSNNSSNKNALNLPDAPTGNPKDVKAKKQAQLA